MINKVAFLTIAYLSIVASALASETNSRGSDGDTQMTSTYSAEVQVAINPQPLPPSEDE